MSASSRPWRSFPAAAPFTQMQTFGQLWLLRCLLRVVSGPSPERVWTARLLRKPPFLTIEQARATQDPRRGRHPCTIHRAPGLW
jgi:hypothetical protein